MIFNILEIISLHLNFCVKTCEWLVSNKIIGDGSPGLSKLASGSPGCPDFATLHSTLLCTQLWGLHIPYQRRNQFNNVSIFSRIVLLLQVPARQRIHRHDTVKRESWTACSHRRDNVEEACLSVEQDATLNALTKYRQLITLVKSQLPFPLFHSFCS